MQMSTHVDARPPVLPAGFAELYAGSYDFVWRCALRLGADPASVEDVVQDSFVVALRRFDDFDPQSGVRSTTWLFGILRNVLRNHGRAERRRQARIERYRQTPRHERHERADATLAGRLVDEFLATLDEDKRAVFVLGEIEGMTGPEIAAALGLNLNTANSRLRAARKAFEQHFVDGVPALAPIGRTRAPAGARRRSLPIVAAAAGHGLGGAVIGGGLLAGLGAKLLAGLVFAGASVGAVVLAASGGDTPAGRERAARVHVSSAAPAELDASPNDTPIEVRAPAADSIAAAVSVAVEQPQPPARASATAKPRKGSMRSEDLEPLADARAALMAGEPARALALVEGKTFDGALERRRASLEVSALCRLDRAGEAERRARAWRSRHADDPQVASFAGVCWDE